MEQYRVGGLHPTRGDHAGHQDGPEGHPSANHFSSPSSRRVPSDLSSGLFTFPPELLRSVAVGQTTAGARKRSRAPWHTTETFNSIA